MMPCIAAKPLSSDDLSQTRLNRPLCVLPSLQILPYLAIASRMRGRMPAFPEETSV